ncbi:hypothetical protein [Flammeovirga kamogawensis]|uniref:Cellulase family glycosylhydrolase n=1 Tax=Flammeovirga kamogawensis TaxID=373891 RepID=A0ABX8H1C2_9BACT|nr:hypothetical protein [Flammeovirga kamogawensis]MBB6462625.1 hypothetical protein [Flammeovirga kamogawensis]QWG09630.1 hypothetical protein KM029_23795 [Flammeovirga kamogawensis]TRX65144.1 hypothetical protein EO216_21695 [Flammeovirga kamogawensis]
MFKKLFLIIIFSNLSIVGFSQTSGKDYTISKAPSLEDYNFVLGTQAIGGKYKFTNDSYIVEQAKQVRAMGSNLLKISLAAKYFKVYPDLEKDPSIQSSLDLLKIKKDYKTVIDMDFKYVFMWIHTLTKAKWNDGVTKQEEQLFYNEMYDLATYLLKKYNNSGKTFMLGNWEGDWLLHGLGNRNVIPSEVKVAGMTKWLQIRQKAVDDAKKKVKHKNVKLYHYVEVNLIKKGMKGEICITESILPKVDVDLVSYSSYEYLKNGDDLALITKDLGDAMDYIESKLQPKKGVDFKRRVFIGEYGFKAMDGLNLEKQAKNTKNLMIASLKLDIPFSLHWEMYNNEFLKDGRTKGMSLISQEGEKKPVYYLHSNYYKVMNSFLVDYKKENNKYPTQEIYKNKAIEVLTTLDYTYSN